MTEVDREMCLADKFQRYLELSGHTRTSFARTAGVDPGMISRLIPRDGRKAERTVDTATVLSLISASNGMLTIDDFIQQGALRRKPFYFRHLCPLCGQKLESAKRKNPAGAQNHGEGR